MVRALRRKRKDAVLKNLNLPASVKKKYNPNIKLETLMKKERVYSLTELNNKYKGAAKKVAVKKKPVKKVKKKGLIARIFRR